jgi:putative hydrolase of the HAD superfamily
VALLLCDLDDTLVSRRDHFRAWATRFLAAEGLPAGDLAWLVETDDDGNVDREHLFGLILERYGLSGDVETMMRRYHAEFAMSFRCEPEVVAALRRARRAGYKVAIVTNGGSRSQGAKVAAAGLAELVDACCISAEEGVWKPDAALFRIAAERCGAPLDGGWMIGDNPVNDIGGATACGLRTVWMRMGRTWPAEFEFAPTAQADTFTAAVDVVLAEAAAAQAP